MEKSIEIVVRGVLLSEGDLLLVRKKGAPYTFLPGGHIAFGETAEEALVREIEEEVGRRPTVEEYLGTLEHAWGEAGDRHHELNLVFRLALKGVSRESAPVSREHWLEFLWHPLDRLKEVNLQPYPLWDLLPQWLRGEGRGWGSSMKGSESSSGDQGL